MKKFKVIIAGSRSINQYDYVVQAVNQSGWADKITEIVCGDAKGVDTLGAWYATSKQIPIKHFPAQWNDLNVKDAVIKVNNFGKYNAKAGLDRNEKMGDYADALICIIKDDSSGSKHMIDYMTKIGKPTYIMEI